MKKALLLQSALAVALATPMLASAESQLVTGAGNASARLDFRVIVPRVLFLAVGTGAAGAGLANNTTIDTLTFDYTTNPGQVGTGAAAGSITGGTGGTGSTVAVRVQGNNGQITLTANTTGALTNATSDTIPWTEISAVSSAPELPSPNIINTGAGPAVNVALNAGSTKATSRAANWTFSYANNTLVAPGTYGTTNGRVTYTAAMP